LTDLARDMPTTRDDVVALRRAGAQRPSEAFAALQALVDQLPGAARQPRRDTAAGRPEFRL
jgi:hypothetical protein